MYIYMYIYIYVYIYIIHIIYKYAFILSHLNIFKYQFANGEVTILNAYQGSTFGGYELVLYIFAINGNMYQPAKKRLVGI